MSESELEEILREVKQRANANVNFNTINITPPNEEDKKQSDAPLTITEEPINEDATAVLEADANEQAQSNSDELEFAPKAEPEEKDDRDELMDILSAIDSEDTVERYNRTPQPKKKNSNKRGLIVAIAVLLVIALAGAIAYFALNKDEESAPEPVTNSQGSVIPPEIIDSNCNPLTGENNYNEAALGKRPVAVVCENEYGTSAVRPQWGIDDADIVLEGESEFSTRLLLFWADYTDVPDMVGPTRSARPPFIEFSQLFDSVYIHAGLSHTEGGYVGADTVFEEQNVDHINLLSYQEDGVYFGRNYDRDYPAIEHTGFLNGTNVPQLLADNEFNTDVNYSKFTILKFNEEVKPLSQLDATSCSFKWSNRCPKEAVFTYDEQTHKYLTEDFDSRFGQSNIQFENLIFLLADTEYVENAEYKGVGETYCNYDLQNGGVGTIISEGTAVEITWGVDDGKLWMKDLAGNDVSLNVGKSYIGYGSNNNGGLIKLNPLEEAVAANSNDYDYDNDFSFAE